MSIYPPPADSAFSATTKTRVRILVASATVAGLVALFVVVTGFPLNQFTSPGGARVTATATATHTALVSSETHLTAISMVSSSEGWAVGYDGAGKRTRLLRFHSGVWTLAVDLSVTILPRTVTRHTVLTALAMDSPDDGWALADGAPILHYCHGGWMPYTPQ